MQNYIKLLTLIVITVFTFSCSGDQGPAENSSANEPQAQEAASEETQAEAPPVKSKFDFRRAKWGMSMEEVMESEPKEPEIKTDKTLDYKIVMMKMMTQVGYTFKDNELIRAGFFFLTKLDTPEGYPKKFEEIKNELIKVNGEPVLDTIQQIDPSKKIDPTEMGQAACNGEVLYATQWDLPTTDIQLVLRGENSECILTILYISEEGMRQMLSERMKNQEQ